MENLCRIAKASGMVAIFLLAQFGAARVAHATPGCSTSSMVSGSAPTSANCQWRYANPPATNGTVPSGSDSGTIYGGITAPPPAPDGTCTAPQCSDGIRQDHGISNILYNYFYAGTDSHTTTTCRFVDNNGSQDLFVPQNSLTEFSDFIGHAPGGVTLAYCTQSFNFQYQATASYPSGYMLWDTDGTWTTPMGSQAKTQVTLIPLPTTRVNMVAPGNAAPPAPGYPMILIYNRQDCSHNAEGATSCRTRTIVETQHIEVTMTPNSNSLCQNPGAYTIDCDGKWNFGFVNVDAYTIDGVPYPSGLSDYDPPAAQTCNGAPDNSTWTTASSGAPITQSCPSGTSGTQQCQTVVTNTYTCNNGASILTNQTPPATISCLGTCTPCASSVPGACPSTNATCGAEWDDAISFGQPMTDLCDVGTPSAVGANNSNGTWNWICSGTGDGTSVSCGVTAATCGAVNGTHVSAAPTASLCSEYETASAVKAASKTGAWTWTCSSGGGVSIPCSATAH